MNTMLLTLSIVCVYLWGIQAELMYMELNHNTPAQYSQLMDNQHVVMIGDCLMRYQYLSLVYLLTTNTFINPNVRPNILNELDFKGDWISFYNTTNQLFAPHEHCDCFRKPSIDEGAKDVYENRYYFSTERNISISYLQYFGDRQQFSGHWQPSDEVSRHYHKPPDLEYVEPKWVYHSIENLLSKVASKLTPKPSVLVLNTGHWPHNWADTSHTQRVMTLAVSLFDRVIYKTTNYNRKHGYVSGHDTVACSHAGVECMDLSWTKHLPAHQYWDMLHFMPGVYRDVNIQFINQVAMRQVRSFVPLNTSFVMSVVDVGEKHYIVDKEGVLRPYSTASVIADQACKTRIDNLKHTSMRVDAALGHVLGEPVSDVCAFTWSQWSTK